MRGAQSFRKTYNTEPVIRRKSRRTVLTYGRSAGLVVARNELIMYRYHYYGAHSGMRWDVVLKRLSKEFYLAECTIAKIIQANAKIGRRIINENPTRSKLKRRFSFFNW